MILRKGQPQADVSGFQVRVGDAQLQEYLVAFEVVKADGLEHLKHLKILASAIKADYYPQSQYPLAFHTREVTLHLH